MMTQIDNSRIKSEVDNKRLRAEAGFGGDPDVVKQEPRKSNEAKKSFPENIISPSGLVMGGHKLSLSWS